MCDTILALPGSTAEQVMLFGKNSDRQRNEAQAVERIVGMEYPPGAQLRCTHLTIPQVRRTHTVLICRPFWHWGAEMGANEYGVVVGNEALQARISASQEPALTGMDVLRLALERAVTAAEALDVITSLFALHGQGGNAGHLIPAYYNNGFIIADSTEAFVLETIGREWMVERVRDIRAISNTYSVGQKVERISAGFSQMLKECGASIQTTNYAQAIAAPNREHLGHAGARSARSSSLLKRLDGQLSVESMQAILRDHGPQFVASDRWHPRNSQAITLCMHAQSEDRLGQTVGSLISEIHKTHAVHWVTATAAPCLSIYKPLFVDTEVPAHGRPLTDRFDAQTLWWRHEQGHRAAIAGDFAKCLEVIRPEREALEASFRERVRAVQHGGSLTERSKVVAACWREANEAEQRWFERLTRPEISNDTPYDRAWHEMNRLAGLYDERTEGAQP